MCQLGDTLESILHPFMSTFGACLVVELSNGSEVGNHHPLYGRELGNLMPESIAGSFIEETEKRIFSALYHLLLNMGTIE